MNSAKILPALGSVFIVACGSGGSGSMAGIDGGGAMPPVATTITSRGTISAFGSVVVNGVRFDTSGATFIIDGEPGSEADLAVGQVVLVTGTIDSSGDSGVATEVTYDDAVEGPIESIDLVSETLVVLGQTVIVSGDTSFDTDISPRSLEGLAIGDVIEVSGYVASGGEIRATHIELEGPGGDFEITGSVTNLDSAASTFEIQSQLIDFSSAMIEDFPNGAPENGLLVEVTGSTFGAAGELLATEVEFRGNDLELSGSDDTELEGLITRFVSATDFDVNGVSVTTTTATQFSEGSAADLALDVQVEVEGQFDAGGVLVAEEVEIEREVSLELGAQIEAIRSDGITLLGVDVRVDDDTEFRDSSAAGVPAFDLSDLSVGDYVEIYAYEAAGTVVATRIERDDDDGDVEVEGIVDSVDAPIFTVLGITIRTSTGTEFEANEQLISADDFFSQAVGRVVEVEGGLLNGEVVAEEVELDD